MPRYILLFCFENLDSRDYHHESLNVVFPRFPNYFLPLPLVFLHVSSGLSAVSSGASPVSRRCFPCFLFRFCEVLIAQAATGAVLSKKLFLKTSQISQKKTLVFESLFNKVASFQAFRSETLLKRDSNTDVFL